MTEPGTGFEPADPSTAPVAVDESSGETPAAPMTASEGQLAAAPDSTAARAARGEVIYAPVGNTPIPPQDVDVGREPLTAREQNTTGAPAGVDGTVVIEGKIVDLEAARRAREALVRAHALVPGTGGHVLFNVRRTAMVIDAQGRWIDGKARRRLFELDAVTLAAIERGDLVDEVVPPEIVDPDE